MNTWSQRFNDALLFDAFTRRTDPGSCDADITMLTDKVSMVIVAPLTGLFENMYKNIQSPDFQCLLSMLTMKSVANWLNCGKNTTLDLFWLNLTANHRVEINSATANQSVVYSFKHVSLTAVNTSSQLLSQIQDLFSASAFNQLSLSSDTWGPDTEGAFWPDVPRTLRTFRSCGMRALSLRDSSSLNSFRSSYQTKPEGLPEGFLLVVNWISSDLFSWRSQLYRVTLWTGTADRDINTIRIKGDCRV